MERSYRPCVLAVIINEDNKILVGERSDRPGVWQMPQGGVDAGESAEEALMRELTEEIGSNDVNILGKLDQSISYEFPEDLASDIIKKYKGQSQDWFLLRLNKTAKLDLSKTLGEFVDLDWKSPELVLANIVKWKKEAYHKGLLAFELIKE